MILLNYWAFLYSTGLIVAFYRFRSDPLWVLFLILISWAYLIPPLLCRLLCLLFGKPGDSREIRMGTREFNVWWFTAQLQVIYLRFPALEEFIRLIPGAYSMWLRFWGARIGKLTYWSPQVKIMDRPFLHIGDLVSVGYGAAFTSHHINRNDGELKLLLGTPTVGARAVLGGLSGVGPGARVSEGEVLPSTMLLAPFYIWKDGRRHSPGAPDSGAVLK